ncbi:MAG: NAD(P)-binding domain-containing protein [Pseudomonadales bacterium]|nr:NAD(P)-binding domain-containing protein [Pseudomonadales bacterium]
MSADVAVIGAGAAGLVTARELHRGGFRPVVFEQSNDVGGIWVYDEHVEDDALGLASSRHVFSSLYPSLRTNLPRHLMAFMDFPFDARGGGEDDWPEYPHHTLVRTYLERFARHFDLAQFIRFGERVVSVAPDGTRWRVATQSASGQSADVFDSVVVANGHYSAPRVPDLPGLATLGEHAVHSHNYRGPEPYRDLRVAVWGTAASGADIAMEIGKCARSVHWCGDAFAERTGTVTPWGATLCASPVHADGNRLGLADGTHIEIDRFVFCTGYRYTFDFLGDGLIDVTDNYVHPLYREILAASHPRLAFIGIPFLVVPFPLFEMQARWLVHFLSHPDDLPSADIMLEDIRSHEAKLEAEGVRRRHFHKLAEKQEAYYNQLANECGQPPLPGWFQALANEAQAARMANPSGFRDTPLKTTPPG